MIADLGRDVAGAAEGGKHDIVHRLLEQGGAVDYHAIDAAGFGDERNDRPFTRGEL